MKKILVIEDEQSIADTICYALNTEGFQTAWKNLGLDGIAYLENHEVDLVVLDVGLPDLNGFEVCKKIRSFSDIPIIFLTARKEEIDRVVGLEIGADDYVIKPFSPRELSARIKVILKRTERVRARPNEQTSDNPFVIDADKARVTYEGQVLDLTRYEFGILKTLFSRPERIFSREELMDRVWQAPESSLDRTVDAHIKTLRAKLSKHGAPKDIIKTHRGLGYSIEFQ